MSTAENITVALPNNWQAIVQAAAHERREVFVSEKEINDTLQWLRQSRASYLAVTRPSQKGDAVEIDFDVKSDGQTVNGGKANAHRLIIGNGGYLPGFEDALMGMTVGEEKDFSAEAPQHYPVKDVAGKHLSVHVKIRNISVPMMPELNDEFAQKEGKFKTLTDLTQNIRDGIRMEKETKERERFRLTLLSNLDAASRIEFPETLLAQETAVMLLELRSATAGMGMPWGEYLRQIKKDEKTLLEEFRPAAHQRVRYALILQAIADKRAIEPSPKEVEDEMNKFLHQFASPEEEKKNVDVSRLAHYTKGALQNEKVFQLLEELTK